MTTFAIGEHDFLRDGEAHRIISGAIHYFRVHPDQWRDRIRKGKAMGLNTIETYVAWNAHEPRRGEWNDTGWNDLGAFLDIVADEDLDAIVRPGPYICAEWHNGGLPVWLTSTTAKLRSSDDEYLQIVTEYPQRVYRIVAPRQIGHGGRVVLVQIENEYGAYGSDSAYLEELMRVTREAGITVPLTTVDQPLDSMLRDGSLPGLHKTASFGSRAAERLKTLRANQHTGPLMCAEFWDGWFDWWGGVHQTTDAAAVATELHVMLAQGASVNFYMFHGGTNFGLTNGANDRGRYLPIVTSYDYDAPLDEAGRVTEKFRRFREVIANYAPVPPWDADLLGPEAAEPPAEPPLASVVIDVPLQTAGNWVPRDPDAPSTPYPPTFEERDHLSAIMRYDVTLGERWEGIRTLAFAEVRDFARVFVDGVPVGTISRTRKERSLQIGAGRQLTVIVEEQGRVNYDHRLGEHKGLIGPATLDGVELTGWASTPIDVADVIRHRRTEEANPAEPTAWSATFELDTLGDLFLSTSQWGEGFVAINGFLLGRYRATGPQETLFVPAAALVAGENTITVLEVAHLAAARVRLQTTPSLGDTVE